MRFSAKFGWPRMAVQDIATVQDLSSSYDAVSLLALPSCSAAA